MILVVVMLVSLLVFGGEGDFQSTCCIQDGIGCFFGKVSSSKLQSVKFVLLTTIKTTFHLKYDAASGVLVVCNARNFPETDHTLFRYTEVFV